MNRIDKERTIVDDEEYSSVIYEKINSTSEFDKIDTKMELKTALNCLSEIEQAVIFLLFNEEISRSEIAEILKIYDSTVSKIKRRAIDKLRKYLDGGFENEE